MRIVSLLFASFSQILLLLVTVKGNGNYSQPGNYGGSANASGGFAPPISSAEKTVDEFLAQLEALSARSADDDMGLLLKKLSQNVSAFLELAFPLGSLIAGSLQIDSKPESDEYKAMKKLHDKLEAKLEQLDGTIVRSSHMIGMDWKSLNRYIDQIHLPIAYFSHHLSLILDPAIKKSKNRVQEFRQLCSYPSHRQDPFSLLIFMHFYTTKYCMRQLSPEQISLLARFVPLLRKTRLQLDNDYAKEKFDEWEPVFINWFSLLEVFDSERILRKMEEYVANLPNAKTFSAYYALSKVKAFFFETGTEWYRSSGSMCTLRDIITGKNFQRKAIEEMENVIRLDVLRLMAFEAICANFTAGESQQRMNWYLEMFINQTREILDETAQFVSSELEKSFPEIEIGVVKSKIDELLQLVPLDNNFTIAAAESEIFEALNQVGSRNFVRRGFVSVNLKNETNFVARCTAENDCFLLSDYGGLHVMVTRFDAELDKKRAKKANEWLKKGTKNGTKNETVERTLWQFIERNYNIDKVSELLSSFEEQHFNLTNAAMYRNMAILRNYGRMNRCGLTVSSYDRPSDNHTESGAAVVDYFFPGTFWRSCENFAVYLYT